MVNARVSGKLILKARTDIYGRVVDLEVLHSDHPLLNQAGLKAVSQWLYEPYIINGIPRPVRFTVTLTFTLIRKDN